MMRRGQWRDLLGGLALLGAISGSLQGCQQDESNSESPVPSPTPSPVPTPSQAPTPTGSDVVIWPFLWPQEGDSYRRCKKEENSDSLTQEECQARAEAKAHQYYQMDQWGHCVTTNECELPSSTKFEWKIYKKPHQAMVADANYNAKSCTTTNAVFDLRGTNATLQGCNEACMASSSCALYTGEFDDWCIGCNDTSHLTLEDAATPDAVAYRKEAACICNLHIRASDGAAGPDCTWGNPPHCYVKPGTCSDGQPSSTEYGHEWSYLACSMKNETTITTTTTAEAIYTNNFGWAPSFQADDKAGKPGTEILHIVNHKGALFAAVGYWMHPYYRAGMVLRLECATCEWQVDGKPLQWPARVECLKSVKWKTPTGNTVELLHASAYMDFLGSARVLLSTRKGPNNWVEGIAFEKKPYKKSYFTARSMYLYTDPIIKQQRLIFPVGQDGIISGRYDPKSPNSVTFSPQVEPGSGPLPNRPLAVTEMDGHVYATSGKFLLKRTKGSMDASWTVVFDMESVTGLTTTDEAVGGFRGLTTINHPSGTSHSLLAAWNPNGESHGCIFRFDPNGQGGFDGTKETCVPKPAKENLGGDPWIAYVIAAYNDILAIPQSDGSTVHLIGYQMLLWGMATYEHPVSYQIAAAGGSRTAYYAGAGYLIRRRPLEGPVTYESRTIMGPRRCPWEIDPIHIATRAYVLSPFPQGGVYFGGYDCNFFPSYDTAWIVWGSMQAVHEYPVEYDWKRKCDGNYTPLRDFKFKYTLENSA